MMHRQLSILAVEHPFEKHVHSVLFAALAVLFVAYLALVAQSVLNIVARKEADARATQMQGAIGILEQQYFALSQAITPESAAAAGLTPIAHVAYIYSPGNAASAQVTHVNAI